MEERPCPAWIAGVIRVVQGDEGALGAACVAVAASLAGMMAIGTLTAWQAGLL